jgi:hypothetical protein
MVSPALTSFQLILDSSFQAVAQEVPSALFPFRETYQMALKPLLEPPVVPPPEELLFTDTEIDAVRLFPRVSVANAVMVCEPFDRAVVSNEYVQEVVPVAG